MSSPAKQEKDGGEQTWFVDDVCSQRAVSDGLLRSRSRYLSAERVLDNPHLTSGQRAAISVILPETGWTVAANRDMLHGMLLNPDGNYRAMAAFRNRAAIMADPQLAALAASDPSGAVRAQMWNSDSTSPAPAEDGLDATHAKWNPEYAQYECPTCYDRWDCGER